MNTKLKKLTTILSLLVFVYLVSNISGVTGFGFDPGDPPGDTTPPTVSITSPNNGATVVDSFVFEVYASDNVAVLKVYFYIDNVYKGYDSSVPYKKTFSTSGYSNGVHSLRATAVDTSGNVNSHTHSVTFYTSPPPDTTPPSVDIISPDTVYYPPFPEVNGIITVAATASDNVAVSYVQFTLRDGDLYNSWDLGKDYNAPYEFELDTRDFVNGPYQLEAKAVDTSGNYDIDIGYFVIVNCPDLEDYTMTYSYVFYTTYECRDPGGFLYDAWIQIDMTAEITLSYTEGVGYDFTYSSVTYETSWDTLMLSPQKCDPVISNRIDWPFQTSFDPGDDGFGNNGPYTHEKYWEETSSPDWPGDNGPYSRVVLEFIVVGNNKLIEYEATIFFQSISGSILLDEEIREWQWDI